MGPYVGNAATFLVKTAFGIYILLVLLRVLLQSVRADFYNPISQFIVKATNPPLRPLRRLIPGVYGLDGASIVLLLALQYLELWLRHQFLGYPTGLPGMVVLSVGELLGLVVNVFMFAIFIQVIVSWLNPGVHNPVTMLLHSLTEPLLTPARRMMPRTAGIDLSPMLVIVGLALISMLVVAPVKDLGESLL